MKKTFTIIVTLGIIIGVAGFVSLAEARPGQVTLTATDDAHVISAERNADSNYGTTYFLRVSKWQYSTTVYEEITWLKFDLSTVPAAAVVDEATLELHTSTVTQDYNVYAHSSPDNSWTELTLTYSNMPSFNMTSMSSTVISAGTTKWYSWNVIDAVRNALTSRTNQVTIVLRETTLRGFLSSVSFDSKEEGNGAYAPKLTVHWSAVAVDSVPPTTLHDYDVLWHTDLTITLTATDDVSGVAETYYRINDGSVKTVSVDGQPLITTEGDNNTLEYWSVDNTGKEESHHILTGIKIDKTAPTIETSSREPAGDVQPDQPVQVSVNGTDALSQVKNVTLYYTVNNGTTWEEPIPMNLSSTKNLYEATIPAQPAGTWVEYKIVAYDQAGNNATLTGTEPYYTYQVISEFPQFLIVPIFIVATLLAVIAYKRKHTM